MQILYKVNVADAKNAWTTGNCKDKSKEFMISKRVAEVLGAALKVKGNTACLYGTPVLSEVTHKDGTVGQRLIGIEGKIVDDLAFAEMQQESRKAQIADLEANPALAKIFA